MPGKVEGIILDEVKLFGLSLQQSLPEYEVKRVSAGVSETEFCTVTELCVRFKCTKRDRSHLTLEQMEVLKNNYGYASQKDAVSKPTLAKEGELLYLSMIYDSGSDTVSLVPSFSYRRGD